MASSSASDKTRPVMMSTLGREQRFIQDHPEWSIHAQEGPRFTAEKDDGTWRHIVARLSPKGLLDRLDEIEGGR